MKHDEIDRILAAEDDILPSSGFAASVMNAVRSEASAPMPIPFPWKRALPGVVAGVVTLVSLVVVVVAQPGMGARSSQIGATGSSVVEPFVETAMNAGAHWIAFALLVTLASVSLSMRLGSRSA